MSQAKAIPLHFVPPRRARGGLRGLVARAGDLMAQHRGVILVLQWCVVLVYAGLVALPAFLPLPPENAHILDNLTRLAQFLFWGIWWPFVIASIMLFGRLWCGVLCPEGALSEWASRKGLGYTIPRWMRWPGWPLVGFLCTTLYGQLLSVYEYPAPVLLILGGSTVAAVGVGLVFGRGKRVWCRYLCPVSGVFALLARVAPLHFRVDRAAWLAYPTRTPAVDCAPLLNVSALAGAAHCHQCGRCSGHRDAVTLALRWPGAEVLAARSQDIGRFEPLLLLYGAIGFAIGAFQWTMAPGFVTLKQRAAEWLIEREIFWPLDDDAPWWLLTHYPAASDVFTWLDGACITAWIVAHALVIGGVAQLCLMAAARILRADWRRLALGLVPLAGLSLFLGLSMLTLNQLRAEGVVFTWVSAARVALLALAAIGAMALGASLVRQARTGLLRSAIALALYGIPVWGPCWLWVRAFGL